MKKDLAHRVAFIGVMAALIFVVLTIETYVFIGILGINPAFLSLPLAIALCLYGDWKEEFVGGTIFGVCAFIISFMVAYVPMYNPLISVLPRGSRSVLDLSFGLVYRQRDLESPRKEREARAFVQEKHRFARDLARGDRGSVRSAHQYRVGALDDVCFWGR